MSKMMTSQADTELSMLANTKYKRCCLRKGLQEREHFGLHRLEEKKITGQLLYKIFYPELFSYHIIPPQKKLKNT